MLQIFAAAFMAMGDILRTALTGFIFFSLTLSVYLPMVPYIVWLAALISWVAVVVEAVIAAPLWALTHLDSEGQGMGQRTQTGYLFIMNVLFRPALLVFGFVLATLLVEIFGKILNMSFTTALASAQAESITGLIAVIGFIMVYILVGLQIVNLSFNMIHVVPNNVLNWLGGQLSNNVGEGMQDHVNSKTGGAITAMGSNSKLLDQFGKKKPQDDKKSLANGVEGPGKAD